MKVFKEPQEWGTPYYLVENEKCLRILFGGNLDLYWHFINQKSREENVSSYENVYETMLITKENYTIYELFENLLREVQNCEVYKPSEVILEPTFYEEFDICDIYDSVDPFSLTDEDRESLTEQYRKETARKRNAKIANSSTYKNLYQNDSIVFYSDDNQLEKADIVKISEVEEGILLEFTRPNLNKEEEKNHMPGTLTIRFSTSGSRYGELVNIFTRMYNKLTEYEPNYHQIHLEELAYQKNLSLQKKDK